MIHDNYNITNLAIKLKANVLELVNKISKYIGEKNEPYNPDLPAPTSGGGRGQQLKNPKWL